MIYLASPYSHPSRAIRNGRFRKACRCAAKLMREGHLVFSPIAHSHSIAIEDELPTDWEFWKGMCVWYVERCEAVYVLALEGWRESVGVQAEIALAGKLDKAVVQVPESYINSDSQCLLT